MCVSRWSDQLYAFPRRFQVTTLILTFSVGVYDRDGMRAEGMVGPAKRGRYSLDCNEGSRRLLPPTRLLHLTHRPRRYPKILGIKCYAAKRPPGDAPKTSARGVSQLTRRWPQSASTGYGSATARVCSRTTGRTICPRSSTSSLRTRGWTERAGLHSTR
jgi:hypothetical protein